MEIHFLELMILCDILNRLFLQGEYHGTHGKIRFMTELEEVVDMLILDDEDEFEDYEDLEEEDNTPSDDKREKVVASLIHHS